MRKALSVLGKAAVSGLLLYFALKSVDMSAIKGRLSQIDPRWMAFALLLAVAQTFVLAVRWRQIVRQCGAALSLGQLFRFGMIASFFNQTLPSSVGGDAIRIWLVGKHSNWRVGTYSVLLDRVVGTVALAIVVVICLPWTLELVRNPIGRAALVTIGIGCIAGGLIFVFLAWERLQILQRWSLTRHLTAAASVGLAILTSPRSLATLFGLSVAIHILTAMTAWCAARTAGADLSLLYAVFLVLPVVLVTVVPISIAGWGVRESAMVAAFSYAGLPASDGLIVSLLFGATYLLLGALGGLVWILTTDRLDRSAVSAASAADLGC